MVENQSGANENPMRIDMKIDHGIAKFPSLLTFYSRKPVYSGVYGQLNDCNVPHPHYCPMQKYYFALKITVKFKKTSILIYFCSPNPAYASKSE